MAQTKRQKAIFAAVTPGKAYSIDEALKIVKDNSKTKFVEAVDVAVRLGVDRAGVVGVTGRQGGERIDARRPGVAALGHRQGVDVAGVGDGRAEVAERVGADRVGVAARGRRGRGQGADVLDRRRTARDQYAERGPLPAPALHQHGQHQTGLLGHRHPGLVQVVGAYGRFLLP